LEKLAGATTFHLVLDASLRSRADNDFDFWSNSRFGNCWPLTVGARYWFFPMLAFLWSFAMVRYATGS
jgi:hypothetical protein